MAWQKLSTKQLRNLLSKVVSKSKRDWHEKLGETLWAYRITYKTTTQSTPYSLVYGVKVVLPLELEVPSLRIAIQEGLAKDEKDKFHLAELEALDEKRLQAQQTLECYQALLLTSIRQKSATSFRSKFSSKWDGPYVVQEVYTNGAYKIVDA